MTAEKGFEVLEDELVTSPAGFKETELVAGLKNFLGMSL
jgi:hypothetical protein